MEEYFVEYDALTSRFKAAERHFEKVFSQIEAIRGDVARKAATAFESRMTAKEADTLLGYAEEFKESVQDYEATMSDIGCPCCRGVPGLKKAANEMIEASDILRCHSLRSTNHLHDTAQAGRGRSSMPASPARPCLPLLVPRKCCCQTPHPC